MRWRLIQFIVLFAVFLVFTMLNLNEENRCVVNFGFANTGDIPVFIPIFFSFMIGMLCMLPFVFIKSQKKQDAAPKKGFFAKKANKQSNKPDTDIEDTGISNNKNYGID